MTKLSVSEFEALVTTGACCKLKTTTSSRRDVVKYFTQIANEILDERLPSLQAFMHFKDAKCFLKHVDTGRIVCEIAIDAGCGTLIKVPKALLVSRKGYVKASTLNELSNWAMRKGTTKYAKGK